MFTHARKALRWYVKYLRPFHWTYVRRLKVEHEAARAYDADHGVETAGVVELKDMGLTAEQIALGGDYWPVWPGVFDAALRALGVDYREFTFVDYGSGKGKALFLASEYPFRAIIGVEFSPLLHARAQENIACYRSRTQQCTAISSVCADATEYDPPETPLVCFIYNSFADDRTLRRVIEKLASSVERNWRPVFTVFVKQSGVEDRAGVFRANACCAVVSQAKQHVVCRLERKSCTLAAAR